MANLNLCCNLVALLAVVLANDILPDPSKGLSKAPKFPGAPKGLPTSGLTDGAKGLTDATQSFQGGAAGLQNTTKGLPGGGLTAGATKGLPDLPTNAGNLTEVTGLATGLMSGCFAKKPAPAGDITERWVQNFGQLGLYNRISYKLFGWKTSLPRPPELKGKGKHTKCWDVQMKTPIGKLGEANQTRTTCKYENNVASEKCALSTTSLDFLGAFQHWGDFIIVKHRNHPFDNTKSYMLVYVCLMGRDNYFLTLAPSDFNTPMDPEIKEEVLAEVKKMGFEEKNIVYDGKAMLSIQKVTLGKCPGESVLSKLPLDVLAKPFGRLLGG